MNELKKPYSIRRRRRAGWPTRKQMQQDQRDMLAAQLATREASCPHAKRELNGNTTNKVMLVHNFPDGLPRGVCLLCRKVVASGTLGIRAARIGTRFNLAATPGYEKVLELEKFATEIA